MCHPSLVGVTVAAPQSGPAPYLSLPEPSWSFRGHHYELWRILRALVSSIVHFLLSFGYQFLLVSSMSFGVFCTLNIAR